MKKETNIKFSYNDGKYEITGDVVNPGGWFGDAWLIGYPLGNFGFHIIVEQGNEGDAIDELADSDKYGHIINVDENDLTEEEKDAVYEGTSDYSLAGNDGHIVDLSNLTMAKVIDKKCKYFGIYEGNHLPDDGLTPKEFYDWINE